MSNINEGFPEPYKTFMYKNWLHYVENGTLLYKVYLFLVHIKVYIICIYLFTWVFHLVIYLCFPDISEWVILCGGKDPSSHSISSYTYILSKDRFLSKDWFFRLAGLALASPLASSFVTLVRFARMWKPHPWTTKASPWRHGFAGTFSCFTSPVIFNSMIQGEAWKSDSCLKTDSSDWPGWVAWILNAVHTTCFFDLLKDTNPIFSWILNVCVMKETHWSIW